MNKDVKHYVVITAELKATYKDNTTIPTWNYWRRYNPMRHNRREDLTEEVLSFKAIKFPYGTRIKIEVPCCPECGTPADFLLGKEENYIGKCSCGFNWEEWIKSKFV